MRWICLAMVLFAGLAFCQPTNVLVYTDPYVYGNASVEALTNLGWPTSDVYYSDYSGFATALADGTEWDIVAVEAYYYFSLSYWGDAVDDYVNGVYGGTGKTVISSFEMDDYSTHSLWDSMGTDYVSDIYYTTYDVYVWDAGHPIWNDPNVLAGPFSVDELNYYDMGDNHDELTDGVEVAGTSDSPTTGDGIVCIGDVVNGYGPTVCGSMCTDSMSDHTTAVEIWENWLTYVWETPQTNLQSTSLGNIKTLFAE
jgi:hypothetical protein